MIPEGWSTAAIGDLANFTNGHGFEPSDWASEGLPIIRIQNLNGSKNFNYYNGTPDPTWLVQPGTLLFAWAGVKGVSFGPRIWDGPLGVLNQHIFRLEVSNRIDKTWFYEVLKVITREIEQKAHGFKSNLVHVHKSDITNQPILIPPFPEQRKIATILGTWDDAIALTGRRIAAGQQRKQALMQRLLTGQLRFPEFNHLAERRETKFGEMPSDWQLAQLQDMAAVNTESLAPSSDADHEWLYIDLSAVDHGAVAMPTERRRFADLPSRARRVLRENDVIMATVRPNLLGFALCDFAPDDVLCSTGFALISAKTLSDARFIYQSLYSKMILGQIQGLLTGSSYPAINSSEVKGLWFCWPQSAEEREKIAEVLAACDHELDLLAGKRDALQQQKRGLMQQLLTGRVRVKV